MTEAAQSGLKRLLVLGANNPETIRVVEAVNDRRPSFELVGFLDNDPAKQGRDFWSFPVLGGSEVVGREQYRDCVVVNSITRDCPTRKQTTEELLAHGARFANLIHPGVDTRHVELGSGLLIQEGTVIQPGAVIGDHCALNGGVYISHECRIGPYCFFAPRVTLAGLVEAGEGVLFGVGCAIMPRLTIGAGAIIGAGAVVTKDVAPGTVVAGNPARVLKPRVG